MITNPTKAYLGDGVYVSVLQDNGRDLVLETRRPGVLHWILLDPKVYAALQAYAVAHLVNVEVRG